MFHEGVETTISCFVLMAQGNAVPPLVIAAFISAFVADAFAMYEVYHILKKLLASPADKKREVTREYDFVIHANFFFVFDGVSGTYQ